MVSSISDSVVALHASDPATVYLSVAARHPAPVIAQIDHELHAYTVRHHAMRRTLWVMSPPVATAAHAAATRKLAGTERRKTIKFLDGDEAWLDAATDAVCGLLKATGPLTTREICQRLPTFDRQIAHHGPGGLTATQSGLSRVLLQSGFEGRLVRGRPVGSWISSQHLWSVPERSVQFDRDVDVSTGAVELTRRLLERFGPMTETDITWWTGSTKTQTRAALAAVGAVPADLPDSGTDDIGWLLPDDVPVEPSAEPWAALLPGLDSTAMGWKQRTWYLDTTTARRVMDTNGNIGPTIWADGQIVGGWVQRPDGTIATELTHTVGRDHQRLIDAEIDRVREFIGDTRFKVRFPSANQKDLLHA